MSATPQPSAFESRTNAAYEALMWAFARPGLARRLPAPGMAGLVETLIDRECKVHATDTDAAQMAGRVGAAAVPLAEADHVFLASLPDPGLLAQLACGSDLYPDRGATVVLAAQIGTGAALRLSGPGIDGTADIRLDGIPQSIWRVRSETMRYPMGFEMVFIDGDTIVGLPRSTHVEVL